MFSFTEVGTERNAVHFLPRHLVQLVHLYRFTDLAYILGSVCIASIKVERTSYVCLLIHILHLTAYFLVRTARASTPPFDLSDYTQEHAGGRAAFMVLQ